MNVTHYILDLNKLIKKIDKRLEKKSKKVPSNKKRRVVGALSHHSSPPAGLPKWMLRPSIETHSELAIYIHIICTFIYSCICVNAGTIDSEGIGTIDSVETVDVPGIVTIV